MSNRNNTEPLYILKSDKSIQQGSYLKFISGGDTLTGQYKNGNQDRICGYYNGNYYFDPRGL